MTATAPAPKRGKYDRAISRTERQAAQRERVLNAISALVSSSKALSVASVVEAAGIGRNTFYEYFDDIEHALSSLTARAVRDLANRIERSLEPAGAPLELVPALCRAWVGHLCEAPALAQIALRAQPESAEPTQVSALAQHVATLLGRELEARGGLSGLNEPLRLLVVAALFDAVSRSHFTINALSSAELERTLLDLTLRVLR